MSGRMDNYHTFTRKIYEKSSQLLEGEFDEKYPLDTHECILLLSLVKSLTHHSHRPSNSKITVWGPISLGSAVPVISVGP